MERPAIPRRMWRVGLPVGLLLSALCWLVLGARAWAGWMLITGRLIH